jgi:hypothetical protein
MGYGDFGDAIAFMFRQDYKKNGNGKNVRRHLIHYILQDRVFNTFEPGINIFNQEAKHSHIDKPDHPCNGPTKQRVMPRRAQA